MCVCSYRMTLRARDHTPIDSHARAFLRLILTVAICAHSNSIMHNKSWTFHFCSQVCYSNMAWCIGVTLKLCHDPWTWISMRCKRPDQKYLLMESMKRCCTKRSKENRKFRRNQNGTRPRSPPLTICRKGKKSNSTVAREDGAASVYLRSASYCAFGSSHAANEKANNTRWPTALSAQSSIRFCTICPRDIAESGQI